MLKGNTVAVSRLLPPLRRLRPPLFGLGRQAHDSATLVGGKGDKPSFSAASHLFAAVGGLFAGLLGWERDRIAEFIGFTEGRLLLDPYKLDVYEQHFEPVGYVSHYTATITHKDS